MRITYADQEFFKGTFERFRQVSSFTDDVLLRETAAWAGRIVPSYGFEEALARDLLVLSTYLAHHRDRIEVADVARGALSYVLHADKTNGAGIPHFGLFDDAFVASYAVHEIRTQLGEMAHYAPPKLTPLEQKHAEELFLSLIDDRSPPSRQLSAEASQVVASLGILAESGILRRLRDNVVYLSSALGDSQRPADQRDIARAALEYVVRGEDAIPDEHGLAGFLDDNFIVQLAVDLIEPRREPWLELLDSLVATWPFLNNLFLREDGTGSSLSEFFLANSALVCPALRGDAGLKSLTIVAPSAGPLPFLLGFISSLGNLYEASLGAPAARTFRVGQNVLVDFNCVRVFGGYAAHEGREGFWLERRGKYQSRQWLPSSNLRRLVPAQQRRATRGALLSAAKSKAVAVPILDLILSLQDSHNTDIKVRPVFVASQVLQTRELATRLTIFDQPMCDVVPMGHLSGTDQIVRWSTSLGAQSPVLVTTPDLDYACEYAEEAGIVPRLVIVDGDGRNTTRSASHARLAAMGSPVVVVTGMAASARSAIPIAESDGDVWEWTKPDLDTILGPENSDSRIPSLGTYETKVRRAFSASVLTHTIDFEPVRKAFGGLSELRACIRNRGEDPLPELNDFIEQAYPCLLRLMRIVVPLNAVPEIRNEIQTSLAALGELGSDSLYFSDCERSALRQVREGLAESFEALLDSNPKGAFLERELPRFHSKVVVCADADRVGGVIARTFDNEARPVSVDSIRSADGRHSDVLISAWFGRKSMEVLLLPPVADTVFLLLYDIEGSWHQGFDRFQRRARQTASGSSHRAEMFPGILGWKQRDVNAEKDHATSIDSEYEAEESIQTHIADLKRQRLLRHCRTDGAEAEVEATMVLFEGGACAFLADGYRARVATHLLDLAEAAPDAELEMAPVSRLRTGDAILFLKGGDSDVIRSVADTLLPAGTRDLARLWQQSLRDYSVKESLTVEELRRRLNAGGCPLGTQAFRIWLRDDDIIGPLAYERDIPVIAQLTSDERLKGKLAECIEAVSRVRGAHLRASSILAAEVVRKAVASLRSGSAGKHLVEVTDQIVLARIEQIDDQSTCVRGSLVNRLLEDFG